MKRAFINGIILNGHKDMEAVKGQTILTENGKITGIVPKVTDLNGYEIVDLQGRYIMPGLINLHVHLGGTGKPKKKQSDPEKLVKLLTSCKLTNAIGHKLVSEWAKIQLMSGVTTIRTVGGVTNYDTWLRNQIAAGKKTGPRILASNMAISVPGGHMAGSLAYEANSPEEARKFVRKIAKDKPDLIKLMITGGVMDAEVVGEPGVLRMSPEIVRAACEEAHHLGYKVAAHTESTEGVKVALKNGVDSIEHGGMPDEEMVDLFKTHPGTFFVGTISPALPYAFFDRAVSHVTKEQQENAKVVFRGEIELAKVALKADIPMGLGTDSSCPYITQYDTWRELNYLVKYVGVTPQMALYTATLLNAYLAGVSDLTGSIDPGKSADFIVTKKNPLDDIQTLRHVTMVVKEGKVILPKFKKIPEAERELDKYL